MAQTVTSQQGNDLDARLLDFVREKIDSFIKWDLVRFFHDNPYSANTAENIAKFAARDPQVVATALDELVASGVLEVSDTGSRRITYVSDQQTRDLVRDFVSACDDRDFRVRVKQVIEGLR
ncbi:MAG: hypothetical protein U0521_29675 [Anaerolineae bacterium]